MTITDDQALTLHIARLYRSDQGLPSSSVLLGSGQCTLDIYIVITAQETVNNSDQDKLLFVILNVCHTHTLESTQMTNKELSGVFVPTGRARYKFSPRFEEL